MGRRFRFTIITAFFNTGDYLKESIESIINQDICFEENVQLILVDDGSTDNSKDIALTYQKLYPENILVLSKENGGPASARNLGLNHVDGDFVNFLDSDDLLSLNTLSDVDKFIRNNDVDIVAIPIVYFDKKEGEHHLNYKFEKEGIVDLNEKFSYSLLSASSSFINADLLENKEFDTNLINGEDLLLINKLLINIKRYGVINSAVYKYRKRSESSSIMDTAKYDKRFFLEKMQNCFKALIDYSISEENKVLKFIQYLITLDLNATVVSPFFEMYSKSDEINDFWDCLDEILSYIDEDIIKNHDYLSDHIKSFYIYLKNKEFHIHINSRRNKVFLRSKDYDLNRLHNLSVHLDIVEIKNNMLCLDGCLVSNSITDSLSLKAIVKNSDGSEESVSCQNLAYPTTNRHVKKFLGIPWVYYYNFEVKIPITDNDYKITFKFLFEENGEIATWKPRIKFFKHCNLSQFSNYFVKNDKIVLFQDGVLHVVKNSLLFRNRLEFKSMFKILSSSKNFKYYSIYIRIISAFVYLFLRNKRIWLFMDRPTVADDNAKHLFKYAVKQDDNIKKYFIIDKHVKDYNEMQKIDKKVIAFGSLKHKILYLYAEKLISTHIDKIWINPFYLLNSYLFVGLTNIQLCFLQHGVTKDDVSSWLRKYYHNFYLFLTSSDYERNSIIDGKYNYSEDVVNTLGFPRFDNLEKTSYSKQILFMPTWRKYLNNDETFKSSEYFELINNFFNNKRLLKLMDDNGYKIVFKPHFNLLPFLDLFNIPKEISINIDDSYQKLFNNSSLLITDYSSVFFDFAYLKKPVIYYRGNDDYHYEEGYFDFETMGFGKIINDEDKLIDKISKYFETNFEMEEKYKKRVDDFFKFTDQNNSKRVYEWLLTHKD